MAALQGCIELLPAICDFLDRAGFCNELAAVCAHEETVAVRQGHDAGHGFCKCLYIAYRDEKACLSGDHRFAGACGACGYNGQTGG